MSWQGEMGTMVRYLVNDIDRDNLSYSDERIETTILVAAQLVQTEVTFNNTYIIDVEQCIMNPDPTDNTDPAIEAIKDDGFISLVSLKAACLVMGSEFKTQSLASVRVSDGPSSIDCTSIASHLKGFYQDLCGRYDEYKMNYVAGNNVNGQAILSPYSPGSWSVRANYRSDSR